MLKGSLRDAKGLIAGRLIKSFGVKGITNTGNKLFQSKANL
jgi:hypothetical protein